MASNEFIDLIKVNDRNGIAGEELARKARERLAEAAVTHFGGLNHGTLGFSREGHTLRCTINLQVSNLRIMVGDADATGMEQAFEIALAKIVKQLLRRKPRTVETAQEPEEMKLAA